MSSLGAFLRQRRAALRPVDVGLVEYGARRVPGLRREEVALLAGVSITYYTRLEQGHSTNASESVLGSLARALALTAVERQHLFDLAGVRDRPGRPAGTAPDFARPGTVRLLDAMAAVPALLLGKRTEVLAWNALGHALVAHHLDPRGPEQPDVRPNLTRLLFLDEATRALYPDWATEAARAVASLRLLSGRFADDPALASLIGEPDPEEPGVRADVGRAPRGQPACRAPRRSGTRSSVTWSLDFEVLSMPDDSGHRLLTYTAAPDSASGRALAGLLASDVA
ncbi:helix-turn-helix transcriptional regulator [Nocardioides convexus]|uniref:helix-turn-helix domain-containing protein n=1 Tax=Nocardioides convexus TaxID=2712224 RepID=UPI00241889F1|nr:helix-turn-helix transcriptional regulator [Nocardioides convexus]